jgi:hypothetical protein
MARRIKESMVNRAAYHTAPITASTHTHMGTPPPDYDGEWAMHTVHVHGFESLSAERGVGFNSPEFLLLGNQWLLSIYPGGDPTAEEGMTSLYLYNESDKAIDIQYGFSVNDGNGKQVAYDRSSRPHSFSTLGINRGLGVDFALRSDLLRYLVNGALVIDIHMKLATPTKSVPPPFIPENPLTKMIQEEFLEEKYSDIVFEVRGDQRKDNATKVAKITPATFPAHRIIVAKFSNTLAEICASGGGDNGTNPIPIEIDYVTPDIFRHLLSYMYGMTISIDDMKSHAKEIIDAADQFGVTSLKLEAEVCLVNNTLFDMENVKELLLYADSKNCALLKEAAMDYMLENKDAVFKNIRFDDAPGSLVSDVFAAIARAEKTKDGGVSVDAGNKNASRFMSMRISELRRMVHEKGLDVDGSREMLIASLEQVLNSDTDLNPDEESEEELDEEPDEE